MTTYCEDCGSKMYNGACTYCHEEIYIEEQYLELGMEIPESISEKADEQRYQIEREAIIDKLNN